MSVIVYVPFYVFWALAKELILKDAVKIIATNYALWEMINSVVKVLHQCNLLVFFNVVPDLINPTIRTLTTYWRNHRSTLRIELWHIVKQLLVNENMILRVIFWENQPAWNVTPSEVAHSRIFCLYDWSNKLDQFFSPSDQYFRIYVTLFFLAQQQKWDFSEFEPKIFWEAHIEIKILCFFNNLCVWNNSKKMQFLCP